MSFLTKKEIAKRLGLYTPDGMLNTKLVIHIFKDLDIDPCGWRGRVHIYDSSVLPKMRHWFWYNYFGDLPDRVYIGNSKYISVVYLPECEGIKKTA